LAGIYFHIPYCKQACHYCDFHFSTQQNSQESMLTAMLWELMDRKEYFQEALFSIYFGGGSPSHVSHEFIRALVTQCKDHFDLAEDIEISLEANPDDMAAEDLMAWREMGFNRLSVGVQSFLDQDLKWMNRAHNAQQSSECIEIAQKTGFDNISLDLIYGIPQQTISEWEENVKKAIALDVQHISAYCLTIEKQTVFGKRKAKGTLAEKPDEKTEAEFHLLKSLLEKAGFVHYEVSNFAKEGFHSRHNSSYWQGKPYLGIGPSAHSYAKAKREWNVANNSIYMKQVEAESILRNHEFLTNDMQVNERIMLGLRTAWGIDLNELEKENGVSLLSLHKKIIDKYSAYLTIENGRLRLNGQGFLLADRIAMELFL